MASSWCFHFVPEMSLPFEGSKNLVHVTILQPVLWCGPRLITNGLAQAVKPFKLTHKLKFTSVLHSAACRHKSAKYSKELHTNISLEQWNFYLAWNCATPNFTSTTGTAINLTCKIFREDSGTREQSNCLTIRTTFPSGTAFWVCKHVWVQCM